MRRGRTKNSFYGIGGAIVGGVDPLQYHFDFICKINNRGTYWSPFIYINNNFYEYIVCIVESYRYDNSDNVQISIVCIVEC